MTEIEPVLISLGSNIEPESHLRRAVEMISTRLALQEVSRVYESLPIGAPQSPLFLNAAVRVACGMTPRELKFELLRPIERRMGRVRGSDKNAPRTLDLDLALYGDRVIREPASGLEVPDPEILSRAHVALPLAEVAPDTRHPVDGRTLAEIASDFAGTREVRPLEGFSWQVE